MYSREHEENNITLTLEELNKDLALLTTETPKKLLPSKRENSGHVLHQGYNTLYFHTNYFLIDLHNIRSRDWNR